MTSVSEHWTTAHLPPAAQFPAWREVIVDAHLAWDIPSIACDAFPAYMSNHLSAFNAGVGVIATGLARAAYDAALCYSRERVQGGRPIFEHQSVRARLFRMFQLVQASRTLSRGAWVYNLTQIGAGGRARLEHSLVRAPSGGLAKQYDERFRTGFGGVAEVRDSMADVAAALRCPTLLVHGGASPVLTREMAERFAAAAKTVELVTIDGAGHSVAGDKPEEFLRCVLSFLDRTL